MLSFDIEFEVFCTCGNGLCHQSKIRTSWNRGANQIVVEPCRVCSSEKYDEGNRDGYQEGLKEIEENYKDKITELKARIAELEKVSCIPTD